MPLKIKIVYFIIFAVFLSTVYFFFMHEPIEKTEDIYIGVRGHVEDITINNDGTGAIHVKGALYDDTVVSEAIVTVSQDTLIKHGLNAGETFKINDLEEKMYLDVYFHGPILESYPVQAKASKIIVNLFTGTN